MRLGRRDMNDVFIGTDRTGGNSEKESGEEEKCGEGSFLHGMFLPVDWNG